MACPFATVVNEITRAYIEMLERVGLPYEGPDNVRSLCGDQEGKSLVIDIYDRTVAVVAPNGLAETVERPTDSPNLCPHKTPWLDDIVLWLDGIVIALLAQYWVRRYESDGTLIDEYLCTRADYAGGIVVWEDSAGSPVMTLGWYIGGVGFPKQPAPGAPGDQWECVYTGLPSSDTFEAPDNLWWAPEGRYDSIFGTNYVIVSAP